MNRAKRDTSLPEDSITMKKEQELLKDIQEQLRRGAILCRKLYFSRISRL